MKAGIKEAFRRLADQLSPENLHEDGELGAHAVDRKLRRLQKEWHALEALAGRKVSEEEAWKL